MAKRYFYFLCYVLVLNGCSKKDSGNPTPPPPPPPPPALTVSSVKVNGVSAGSAYYGINTTPVIKVSFSSPVNRSSVNNSFILNKYTGGSVSYTVTYENNDSTVVIQPSSPLGFLTKYYLSITTDLRSQAGGAFQTAASIELLTAIDPADKFPVISDNALLDLVQQQTFKYFWDFADPTSGLARERSNGDNNVITSGGSGFGIMAIVTGIHRNFITRAQGLARMQTIVAFLKNTAQKFHGAFPHWLHGTTGVVIPFSTKDNGADLVETSYLMQGLLTARQYFNGADAAETALRNDINILWNGVEWSWFRQNNQNVLYWHWSQNYNWDMNFQIRGWNECLITYVLAGSSLTSSIPKIVYDNGWAQNGAIKNNKIFYSYQLPLGPDYGGPLFFAHYSFLGINPNGLNDTYANYQLQTTNHTKINYEYCKANPKGYYGYSDQCWGLTASDIPNGYTASSPTNDVGVIAPTAALSSFPYTPTESMNALKFFYYKLGDKLWGPYGFKDAFTLHNPWFADSYLAIDQGPIIVMIENYRTGLLWSLFTSCPEVKTGMKNLGFTAPYL
ncbi:MAG TPA: glucoamylase family protein [Chitinophagaceae bacterium]|nr:glucoamylase family protein [Chitinophagaceae bacterium]